MKHRLVGAAVLVALGVIAWPVIFDTTPVREISQRSELPAAPSPERFEVPEPQRPPPLDAELPQDDSGSPAPVEALGPDEPLPEAVLQGDARGLPEQWAVQLGVFSQLDNARELHARALEAGYHAVMQKSESGGKTQYRVLVEPKLDRRALDALLPEIRRRLGLEGYVTRYYP